MLKGLMDLKQVQQFRSMELFSGNKAYSTAEILEDLKQGIFSELSTFSTITLNRLNVQRAYLLNLIALYRAGLATDMDVTSIVKQQAKNWLLRLR